MNDLFIDVETTGFGHKAMPPREDAIIQVGMAWRDARQNVQTWSRYCYPGPRFFEGGRAKSALAINGIDEIVLRGGKSVEEVSRDFWDLVFQLESRGQAARFYSYNVAFDAPFLETEPWGIPRHRFGECVMLKAQDHLDLFKWPKLQEATSALGIPWPQGKAHDAGVDAHAALLVYEKIAGSAFSQV